MTSTTLDELVVQLCRTLKLPSVGREAPRKSVEAIRQGLAPLSYLVELLETEVLERHERRARRWIKEAGFPKVKTLEGFDFRRAPHLPEALLRQLAHGGYIDQAEPILFLGDPGTGKTHLATALGIAAAQQGRRVRFTTAASLVSELVEARDARALAKTVARYGRTDLLIVDELAYVPLLSADAELLFRILGERHERLPIIVTTNLPFSEWTTMFPDPRLCRAIVDRLTHKAHIIETGTQSGRLYETLQRQQGSQRRRETSPT